MLHWTINQHSPPPSSLILGKLREEDATGACSSTSQRCEQCVRADNTLRCEQLLCLNWVEKGRAGGGEEEKRGGAEEEDGNNV